MRRPSAIRSMTSRDRIRSSPRTIRLIRGWLKPSIGEAIRSWLAWSHLRISRKAAAKS